MAFSSRDVQVLDYNVDGEARRSPNIGKEAENKSKVSTTIISCTMPCAGLHPTLY